MEVCEALGFFVSFGLFLFLGFDVFPFGLALEFYLGDLGGVAGFDFLEFFFFVAEDLEEAVDLVLGEGGDAFDDF